MRVDVERPEDPAGAAGQQRRTHRVVVQHVVIGAARALKRAWKNGSPAPASSRSAPSAPRSTAAGRHSRRAPRNGRRARGRYRNARPARAHARPASVRPAQVVASGCCGELPPAPPPADPAPCGRRAGFASRARGCRRTGRRVQCVSRRFQFERSLPKIQNGRQHGAAPVLNHPVLLRRSSPCRSWRPRLIAPRSALGRPAACGSDRPGEAKTPAVALSASAQASSASSDLAFSACCCEPLLSTSSSNSRAPSVSPISWYASARSSLVDISAL